MSLSGVKRTVVYLIARLIGFKRIPTWSTFLKYWELKVKMQFSWLFVPKQLRFFTQVKNIKSRFSSGPLKGHPLHVLLCRTGLVQEFKIICSFSDKPRRRTRIGRARYSELKYYNLLVSNEDYSCQLFLADQTDCNFKHLELRFVSPKKMTKSNIKSGRILNIDQIIWSFIIRHIIYN